MAGTGGGMSAVPAAGGGGLSGEARAKGMIQEFREKDDEDQVRHVRCGLEWCDREPVNCSVTRGLEGWEMCVDTL